MASLLDTPLSIFALPILYVTVLYPHAVKGGVVRRALRVYPNISPRASLEMCKKKGVPEEVIRKVQRLEGAHQNGNEGFPLWAISIVTANLCGVAPQTINKSAAYLIVARMIYNWLYSSNERSRVIASARSFTWISTVGVSFYLLIKAGLHFHATA